jgi:sodium/bile acid cotransporter 7
LPFRAQYHEVIPLKSIVFWGIVGIFFLYGLKLKPKEMLRDISNWKLHLLAQGATFLFFPILVLLLYPLLKESVFEKYWIALFFLSALHSTVTMSVIFVEKMKGNLGGAIFNSSISGLLAIVFTPLWLGMFLSKTDAPVDYLVILLGLIKKILLPLLAGMLFRQIWKALAPKIIEKLKYFDKIVIMLIVYSSFSNAFEKDIFASVSWAELLALLAVVVSLHLTMFESMGFLGKLFKLPSKDQKVLLW